MEIKTKKSPLLPEDTLNIILEYAGYHKWRHGKYMRQLSPQQTSIPYNPTMKKKFYIMNQLMEPEYTVHFTATNKENKKTYDYFITTEIFHGIVHWYMDVFDAHTYHLERKKCLHYAYTGYKKKHRPRKKNA
jgi:hypothetical protein